MNARGAPIRRRRAGLVGRGPVASRGADPDSVGPPTGDRSGARRPGRSGADAVALGDAPQHGPVEAVERAVEQHAPFPWRRRRRRRGWSQPSAIQRSRSRVSEGAADVDAQAADLRHRPLTPARTRSSAPVERFLQPVGHLRGEALLDLQGAGVGLHHAVDSPRFPRRPGRAMGERGGLLRARARVSVGGEVRFQDVGDPPGGASECDFRELPQDGSGRRVDNHVVAERHLQQEVPGRSLSPSGNPRGQ